MNRFTVDDINFHDLAKELRNGAIILMPTDTVYGLVVDPNQTPSVGRIYSMKGRTSTKMLPIVARDPQSARDIGLQVGDEVTDILRRSTYPRGAFTFAVGVIDGGLAPYLAGRVEVAVRFPSASPLADLLERSRVAYATSANLSSQSVASSVDEALRDLTEQPDIVIDGGRIDGPPSTLINLRVRPPVVERVGLVPHSEAQSLIEEYV